MNYYASSYQIPSSPAVPHMTSAMSNNGVAMVVSQHSPEPESPQQNKRAIVTDRVNGIGMWKAWTRSFDTPMLALLDLFDNAVDASWGEDEDIKGRIAVELDTLAQQGVVMRNTCTRPIPPIKQVLEVYKSNKGGDEIGENGIGVKHACASLCRLSFLLTRTPDDYGVGILMEDLQQEEGVVLPSAQWPIEDDLEEHLRNKAQKEPETWGIALTEYGDGILDDGIDRILHHFKDMTRGETWQHCLNIFTVLLTRLRHVAIGEGDENEDGTIMHDLGDNSQERSLRLLGELRDKLPKLYIHIHPIQVSVQHQLVENLYWERRLLELTQFEVAIHSSMSWYKDPYTVDAARPPFQHKTIRFFAGFDPYRCSDSRKNNDDNSVQEKNSSALRVFMYSRESGRLIKVLNDPRSDLALIAGSTDFKQGLTILVDDFNGTLPLNPTKQDTAFGHSAHGLTHNENIKEWIAAITHFYWLYHYERFGSSKAALTRAVNLGEKSWDEIFDCDELPEISPLSCGTFITYPHVKWRVSKHNGFVRLRTSKHERSSVVPTLGRHTLLRLTLPVASNQASSRKQTARKLAATHSPHFHPPRKAARTVNGRISYNEDDLAPDIDVADIDEDRGAPAHRLMTRTNENNYNHEAQKEHELNIKKVENERDHYKAKAARLEQDNTRLQEKVKSKRAANHELRVALHQAKEQASDYSAQLQKAQEELEKTRHMKQAPSTSDDSDSQLVKLRKDLQFAKSQARFFKEQVEKKEERIESLKKNIESLQDENKLYEKQLQQLQEFQQHST